MDKRVSKIAELAGYSYQDTYELIFYPEWDNPEEHMDWYANASDNEVATWVDACLAGFKPRVDE